MPVCESSNFFLIKYLSHLSYYEEHSIFGGHSMLPSLQQLECCRNTVKEENSKPASVLQVPAHDGVFMY